MAMQSRSITMGIDYCAGYADVIEWDAIVQLVPQAAADFLAEIDKHKGNEDVDYVLAGLARCYRFSEEDPEELRSVLSCGALAEEDAAIEEVKAAFKKLRNAFRQATRVAKSQLELHIGYHDSQNQGCRGDEID